MCQRFSIYNSEDNVMSHALKNADRLYIPPRDKGTKAYPRASMDTSSTHADQVKNAFAFGFSRYEKAMEELSKV